VDAGGENIFLEQNEGVVWRIKPRYNPDVNTWWISDDTRYAYKIIQSDKRLIQAMRTQYGSQVETSYGKAVDDAITGLKSAAAESGPGSLYAVLSPMMACEEAYLLAKAIRALDPSALLVSGPAPTAGEDQIFKHYMTHKETFRIKAEKVPNAAGIRRVLKLVGGPTATWDEFTTATRNDVKNLKAGWIVGGYLSNWLPSNQPPAFKKGFRILQDILDNDLAGKADILLPSSCWAETDGTWENHAGKIQPYAAAVPVPEGIRRAGDVYYTLLNRPGLYNAQAVRQEMGESFANVQLPSDKETAPAFDFVEL
jgi:NADH-quinone oxidoreductase subunit G